MIKIMQKEIRNATSWCRACVKQCGVQEDMICELCRGFVVTYHQCPNCHSIGSFFGYDRPDMCTTCKYVWPNVVDLKDDAEARVKYHTGERK